jgi:hypothetical protein
LKNVKIASDFTQMLSGDSEIGASFADGETRFLVFEERRFDFFFSDA